MAASTASIDVGAATIAPVGAKGDAPAVDPLKYSPPATDSTITMAVAADSPPTNASSVMTISRAKAPVSTGKIAMARKWGVRYSFLLMHADGEKITHGAPIDSAKVTAEVVEQRKDKKVVAYKFRRRKGYHRTVGHRRKLTRLKIKSISVGGKKSAKREAE